MYFLINKIVSLNKKNTKILNTKVLNTFTSFYFSK